MKFITVQVLKNLLKIDFIVSLNFFCEVTHTNAKRIRGFYMESLWKKELNHSGENRYAVQQKTENTHRDVIIIGAGMAGMLTAYYLKEQGKDVLVLEADKIASGQTEKTTAKITSQHGVKYSTLIKQIGKEKAKLYAKANEEAIEEYAKLIEKEGIQCDFKRVPSYLYTFQKQAILKKEAKAARAVGIDAEFTMEVELPFSVAGGVCFQNQAQFFPLKFLQHICANIEVWENTKVKSIRGKKVITEKGELTAEHIVVATHYPILNAPGFYFLRQHQERSYVLALSGCPKIEGMYYGIDSNGLSFRQAGEYLLLGGSSHRTGEHQATDAYDFLLDAANRYFPQCKEVTRWSAQDCMPHDGIPFIGKYSVFMPHLYVATGFQKWGMTSSMVAAQMLRDEICGLENPYRELFSPQRLHIRAGFRNLAVDTDISTDGMFRGIFHRPNITQDALAYGQGRIVSIRGKRYACYRDENGLLHKISARCPHMGCELSWNADEKSWDCPCHGSRFDIDGQLLDNPSKRDACVK